MMLRVTVNISFGSGGGHILNITKFTSPMIIEHFAEIAFGLFLHTIAILIGTSNTLTARS